MPGGLGMSVHFDTGDLEAAFDRLAVCADVATEKAVRNGIVFLTRAAMEHAPVGKSVSTPRHVGGALRRSIRIVEVTSLGPARWQASAGPAIIYGRQRDLGGTIHAKNVKCLKFQIDGNWVLVKSVTQKGSFFMEKAIDDTNAVFNEIFAKAWDEAVRV